MEDDTRTTSRNRRRRASTTLEEESVASDAPDRKRPRRSSRADSVASVSSTPSRSSSRIAASKNRRAPPLPHTVSLSVIDGSDGEDDDDDELVPPAPTTTISAKKAKKTKATPKKKKESPKAREVGLEETSSPTPKSTLESPSKMEDASSTTSNTIKPVVKSRMVLFLKITTLFLLGGCALAFFPRLPSVRSFYHIIPPQHVLDSVKSDTTANDNTNNSMYQYQHHTGMYLTNTTLREFLTDPEGFHLAMAPSFFGFFGYFGMLAAWDEGLVDGLLESERIQSVAGASAGAMAAMLLAMGIAPRKAADFCATIDLATFADPPGIGSFLKGDIFEQLMLDFIKAETEPGHSLKIEDTHIPVAVTGFDLQTMSTLIMTQGCVARSARASATFPFLFQPVHWFGEDNDNSNDTTTNAKNDYILIDGGVLDPNGLEGLTVIEPEKKNKRVVNMLVGNFMGCVGECTGIPPSPSEMPDGLSTSELLSISIQNLPRCGPWAMANGPRAVEAANKAMLASLDLPLYRGKEDGHYELHIDASSFAPNWL